MENQKRLEDWIEINHKELGLSVTSLNWTKDNNLDFYDFYSTIQISNRVYQGRGTSRIKNEAIIKSIVEAIERVVCFDNDIHSNGVAAHSSIDMAKENAKNELIERDNYLSHYLLHYKGKSINSDPRLNDLLEFLNNNHFSYEFKNVSLGRKCSIAFYATFNNTTYLGFGCSNSLYKAQEKALFEALTKISSALYKKIDNGHSSDNFKDLINQKITINNDIPIELKRLHSKSKLINSAPLYFYRATSKNCQNLFQGKTTKNKINLLRLKSLLPDALNINFNPHPVG